MRELSYKTNINKNVSVNILYSMCPYRVYEDVPILIGSHTCMICKFAIEVNAIKCSIICNADDVHEPNKKYRLLLVEKGM